MHLQFYMPRIYVKYIYIYVTWCVQQCTGRCLGPAVATQSRTVSCRHFSNSTSKTCDPKERCQTRCGIFSITYSHMQSSFIIHDLIPKHLSGRHPWGTAPPRCVTCTGRCFRGGRAPWRAAAASSPVEWSVSIGRTEKLSPTNTAPGNGGLLPGNTATSLPVAVGLLVLALKPLVINQAECQYSSKDVCPCSTPLDRSCFIGENITDLRAKYIGLIRHSWRAAICLFFYKLTQRPERARSCSWGFLLSSFRNPVCPNICFLFFTLLCWNLMKHFLCHLTCFWVQKYLIK